MVKGFRHILEYVLTSQVQEHGSHEHSIFPLKISFAVVLAGDVSDGAGTNPAGIPLGRKQIAVGISYRRARGSVVNDNSQSAVPFEPGHCPDVWPLLANAGFQRIFQQVQWTDDDMEGLHEMLLKKHKQNRECMKRLKEYISENFSYTLNAQEEVYLLVHLSKIFY